MKIYILFDVVWKAAYTGGFNECRSVSIFSVRMLMVCFIHDYPVFYKEQMIYASRGGVAKALLVFQGCRQGSSECPVTSLGRGLPESLIKTCRLDI